MYEFGPINKTNRSSLKSHFPLFIAVKHNYKTEPHYFTSVAEAEDWLAWATSVTANPLPVGVTIDLRSRRNPFLVRKRIGGKQRVNKRVATIEEAVQWLESVS
jgi:hypothetical protein